VSLGKELKFPTFRLVNLIICWTDLYEILRIEKFGRAWLIVHSHCDCSKDVARQPFLWPNLRNWPTLAFPNGFEYRNSDLRRLTGNQCFLYTV